MTSLRVLAGKNPFVTRKAQILRVTINMGEVMTVSDTLSELGQNARPRAEDVGALARLSPAYHCDGVRVSPSCPPSFGGVLFVVQGATSHRALMRELPTPTLAHDRRHLRLCTRGDASRVF